MPRGTAQLLPRASARKVVMCKDLDSEVAWTLNHMTVIKDCSCITHRPIGVVGLILPGLFGQKNNSCETSASWTVSSTHYLEDLVAKTASNTTNDDPMELSKLSCVLKPMKNTASSARGRPPSRSSGCRPCQTSACCCGRPRGKLVWFPCH
jgi:hypothetical protein